MFLWEWALGDVMNSLCDWCYSVVVGMMGALLGEIGMLGYDLIELPFVQAILMFFRLLAWALYVVGLVVAVFEAGIEYQSGRGSLKDTALSAIKGFMAVSLFTVVPVRLYKLSIDLQILLTSGITGIGAPTDGAWENIMQPFVGAETLEDFQYQLGDLGGNNVPVIFYLFFIIMMAYAFIKVFFASFKRGGILLIQMSVGSLYMFSISRGYTDAFYNWCKQVLGLCLTSFLQGTILTVGMLILKPHPLLGLGLMLSATEIPRIAGMFGMDTSMRVNVMGAVHGAQAVVRTIGTVVGK